MARPVCAMALLVVLASATGACSSSHGSAPSADGPLTTSTEHGFNCASGTRLQTFGDQLFTNHGRTSVVVDRVVLMHPRGGERLIAAYAVPSNGLVGVQNWPPHFDVPPAWKDRRLARGYRLAPGKTFGMVLEVAGATVGTATSQGMLVYYHDPAAYVTPNHFAMIIAPPGRVCT
jgi:hypothetical protein